MMKKLLAAVLACLMLISTVSCANLGDGKETGDGTSGATGAATVPETEAPTEFFPDVEEADYKGATFHMIAHESAIGAWYYAEEFLSGGGDDKMNILNNTVYEMNTMVEDHLGIDFAYTNVTTITSADVVYHTVNRTMVSGDDEYQLCILHPYASVYSFVSKNSALDFYELEDLDLERDYWNLDVMESLSINNHAYIGFGDICNNNLFVLYCNREILEDAGRSIPYDKVRNNTWTFDEFAALTADIYRDNGDGIRNNRDTYGFTGLWDINGAAFLEAADIYVLTRNGEGEFELSLYGDRLINYYEKLYDWSRNGSTYIWEMSQWGDSTIAMDFHDGLSAITHWSLGGEYLDAEFEYGILPMPKYDVAQENYAHVNWGNNIVVPTTVENRNMVGQVLELMAYYSKTVVREVYHNDVLQLRVSERPDDREMVELICDTIVFDPGLTYCLGSDSLYNLAYITCFGIREGRESIDSYYRTNERGVKLMLDRLSKIGA